MSLPEPYAVINLPDTFPIIIYDHSRVYFGDYYRVTLEIRCEITYHPEPVSNGDKKPAVAVYSRLLEKMAVPEAAVEETRRNLIAEFTRNSLPYMLMPDFPEKLVAGEAAQQKNIGRHGRRGR